MSFYKIGIKIFSQNSIVGEPPSYIPLFHKWIQQQIIKEHLLVDVLDYSHVNQGPGILLVGHEGHFGLSKSKNDIVLYYSRKQKIDGNLIERLNKVFSYTIMAARQLENETDLSFNYGRFNILANDRIASPNDIISEEKILNALERLAINWGLNSIGNIQNVSTLKGVLELQWELNQKDNIEPIHKILRRTYN